MGIREIKSMLEIDPDQLACEIFDPAKKPSIRQQIMSNPKSVKCDRLWEHYLCYLRGEKRQNKFIPIDVFSDEHKPIFDALSKEITQRGCPKISHAAIQQTFQQEFPDLHIKPESNPQQDDIFVISKRFQSDTERKSVADEIYALTNGEYRLRHNPKNEQDFISQATPDEIEQQFKTGKSFFGE